ncbi:hypothetical protein CXG81DRAFT_21286 [Caulochytrium protostelioides]|uniref:Zn(2)-C6 fungal-type domain-containing protein n=1 Tax=Caulochytrium protostelioides TaxID=1555241 RepID=A0A4P9X149_9FUNG|nr:hypothetical protein CXG81DRAFT_21286 [Caulochytrium protostelioides]|eukprot:RKO98488.1 hypothetical protein CXG81DRAFT_21286 [Caulochytrium protostelioides]
MTTSTGTAMSPGSAAHAAEQASQQRKRRQVRNACVNCQKACKKCDDLRPCTRCQRYGLEGSCVDSVRKKRKKPSTTPGAGDGAMTLSANPSVASSAASTPPRGIAPHPGAPLTATKATAAGKTGRKTSQSRPISGATTPSHAHPGMYPPGTATSSGGVSPASHHPATGIPPASRGGHSASPSDPSKRPAKRRASKVKAPHHEGMVGGALGEQAGEPLDQEAMAAAAASSAANALAAALGQHPHHHHPHHHGMGGVPPMLPMPGAVSAVPVPVPVTRVPRASGFVGPMLGHYAQPAQPIGYDGRPITMSHDASTGPPSHFHGHGHGHSHHQGGGIGGHGGGLNYMPGGIESPLDFDSYHPIFGAEDPHAPYGLSGGHDGDHGHDGMVGMHPGSPGWSRVGGPGAGMGMGGPTSSGPPSRLSPSHESGRVRARRALSNMSERGLAHTDDDTLSSMAHEGEMIPAAESGATTAASGTPLRTPAGGSSAGSNSGTEEDDDDDPDAEAAKAAWNKLHILSHLCSAVLTHVPGKDGKKDGAESAQASGTEGSGPAAGGAGGSGDGPNALGHAGRGGASGARGDWSGHTKDGVSASGGGTGGYPMQQPRARSASSVGTRNGSTIPGGAAGVMARRLSNVATLPLPAPMALSTIMEPPHGGSDGYSGRGGHGPGGLDGSASHGDSGPPPAGPGGFRGPPPSVAGKRSASLPSPQSSATKPFIKVVAGLSPSLPPAMSPPTTALSTRPSGRGGSGPGP